MNFAGCRRPFTVFNLFADYSAAFPNNVVFPDLILISTATIPFSCRIVGFSFSTALASTFTGRQGCFLIIGQTASLLRVSDSSQILVSSLFSTRAPFGISENRAGFVKNLFFKRSIFSVAAGESVSLYSCRVGAADTVVGCCSLFLDAN